MNAYGIEKEAMKMGTVGTSLIKDIDVQDIISTLDSFHAYEMVAMHFNFALQNLHGVLR